MMYQIRATLLFLITIGALFIPLVLHADQTIIGGELAAEGEFPSAVIIKYNYSPNVNQTYICGGSLIAEEWVLTAAHCVYTTNAQSIEVIVGTNRTTGNSSNTGRQVLKVQEVIKHPNFVYSTLIHDIALLKIDEAALIPGVVEPVIIGFDAPSENDVVQLIGWGAFEFPQSDISTRLKKTTHRYISKSACEQLGGDLVGKQVCSLDDNAQDSACYGDSGGPLFNQRLEQIALIIDGVAVNCNPEMPNIHTYIPPYIPWISAETSSVATIRADNQAYFPFILNLDKEVSN